MTKELWENFAVSCERNKAPILAELTKLSLKGKSVLEIGSLSGQHACYFADALEPLVWQPSDVSDNIGALNTNILRNGTDVINAPITLNVAQSSEWPSSDYDLVYTANTLHIMSWFHVEQLFSHLSLVCKKGANLAVYGPFKFNGNYTSSSNAEFNEWLKVRDENSGIRDFESVNKLAEKSGFTLISNTDMPANNQMIIWKII